MQVIYYTVFLEKSKGLVMKTSLSVTPLCELSFFTKKHYTRKRILPCKVLGAIRAMRESKTMATLKLQISQTALAAVFIMKERQQAKVNFRC